MLMSELIIKKRDGGRLTREELRFIVQGYVDGSIPDYQIAAFLMAVFFRGMDSEETLALTMEMVDSGDVLDLSSVTGVTADKHSTGGVGDKTSLVLVPMVAAVGVKMAKMSGRGLGHTGGTLDKLESIPGFNIHLDDERFIENVNTVGMVIAGQTAELVPADKKLYALRDVTGTVNSIPLIVSSIMSKKLAAGAKTIVLDVKVGKGSFMKTDEDARTLARELVRVGNMAGRNTAAVITDMDQPLGYAVGNALEVREAISALKGEQRGDLMELCLTLGSCILAASGMADSMEAARALLQKTIEDGSALGKLREFIVAQEGDPRVIDDPDLLPTAPIQAQVVYEGEDGYVSAVDALGIGMASLKLGGGRATKESEVDLSVGVELKKKAGDPVKAGDVLAVVHAASEEDGVMGCQLVRDCIAVSGERHEMLPFIREIVR